ncbi:nucleotidyl transferase AbiEii/AbiGii toxin family protein [Candidatus Berkelbacteria bacterium]|nr:nucleotidyl transferase AbiEii/AbiGii toxin family protein [Candidatus Berkelbacteria bacterium]
MFEQVLPGHTKEYLALLAKKKILPSKTYLAGGTAIALQLGHRISFDLDFFTPQKFNEEVVLGNLKKIKGFKLERSVWQTIVGKFPGCKFSLFYYQYRLIGKIIDYRGVTIASPEDLVASKIAAISSLGAKRDFIDLYYLLQSKRVGDLSDCLKFYDQRFENLASQRLHILKSLDYFADANQEKDEPKMLVKDYSWEKVKDFLREETRKLI